MFLNGIIYTLIKFIKINQWGYPPIDANYHITISYMIVITFFGWVKFKKKKLTKTFLGGSGSGGEAPWLARGSSMAGVATSIYIYLFIKGSLAFPLGGLGLYTFYHYILTIAKNITVTGFLQRIFFPPRIH